MRDCHEASEEFIKSLRKDYNGVPVLRTVRAKGDVKDIEFSCADFGYINGYHNAEKEAWEIIKNIYERITGDKVDPEIARCWDRIDYYNKKLIERFDGNHSQLLEQLNKAE